MAQRVQFSLKVKATVPVIAIILLAIGSVAWLNEQRASKADRVALESLTQSYATSLAAACELPIAVGDTTELERLANRFIEVEPEILFITIYDANSNTLARVTRDGEDRAPSRSTHSNESQFVIERSKVRQIESIDMLGIPPTPGKEIAAEANGSVEVGTSLVSMQARHRRSQRVAAFTTAIAISVSIVLVLLLVNRWIKRLEQLASASELISRGDLSNALTDDRPDEIGTLVRSFERMRVAIDERDRLERQRQMELKRARTDAESASLAKSQFLAHMSHEIRTPLNGVVGMLDLLGRTDLTNKQQRFVHVGQSSAEALLGIINDILDFSKIEAGQMSLESIKFGIHEIIESVVEILAPKGQEKGLEMICVIEKDVPQLGIGDPSRFRQIILNLLNNAIKFTETGEVILRASLVTQNDSFQTIKVSVADTGIGIEKSSQDLLFKSFSQVDTSTTRRFGGTGLGLAICKSLTDLMEGEIGINKDRAQGSEFWFTMQIRRCEQQTDTKEYPSLARQRILVVDDNLTNREILLEALAGWHASPTAVAHAQDALESLRNASKSNNPFTMAILDMQMPDMDGVQLADAIQSDPDIDPPRILMLSSMADSADQSDLANIGIEQYLSKPVRLSTLYETLGRMSTHATPIAPIPEESQRLNAKLLEGKQIMVAEDNPVNQVVIFELLKQFGITVEIVENGKLAVERWTQSQFDVILMDSEMPIMDGLKATQRIREIEHSRKTSEAHHIPIIALTANAIQGDRERCLAAGMDDYLTKPIHPENLLKALVRHTCHQANSPTEQCHNRHTDISSSQQSTPNPPLAAAQSIDIEQALARCGGSPKVLSLVYNEFDRSAKQSLTQLESLANSGNYSELARVLHSMKGATANISAARATTLVADLETLSQASSAQGIDEALTSLKIEMESVFNDISSARTHLAQREKTYP